MVEDVILVPLKGFTADLTVETEKIIHIPLATRNTYGVVKVGEGLLIDADGTLSFDRAEVTILSIVNSNEIDPATGEKRLKLYVPNDDKQIDLELTKYSVGLNEVDNTSDMDKPISTAQQAALDKKQNIHVGPEHYNQLLWVNKDGNIDFIQSFGSIQTLLDGIAVSNDTRIFNFSSDFNVRVVSDEEHEDQEVYIEPAVAFKALLNNVTYDGKTGILTFEKYDGTKIDIDLPLELLVKSGYYDKAEKDIILVLANDETIAIPVDDIIAAYYGDEKTITLTTTEEGLNIFSVKDGGIDATKLSKAVIDLINSKASQTDLDVVIKKNTEQDDEITKLKSHDSEQDDRLDVLETNDLKQDGRLTKLESSDSSQNTRLSNLETASAEQGDRISTLEDNDKVQDNRLDTLESNDETQDQRLTALESTTATHTTQIQQLQTDNAAQDERQNTLETAIATEKTNRETEDAAIRKEIQTIQAGETELNEQILNRLQTLETTKASTEYVDNKNSEQDTRLTNIETKNTEQDTSISQLTGDLADTNSNLYDLSGEVTAIKEKIPTQASKTNQLADKMFVNSTIQTATANFRGNWANWDAVPAVDSAYPADYAGSKKPTVNDYLVVEDASDYAAVAGGPPSGLKGTWRFKFTGTWASDGKDGWLPEYRVNEEPFTAAQLAAINSGITVELTEQITTNKNDITINKNDISSIKNKNTQQDTAIAGVKATADAAMPKSGGQFTGRVSWNATSLPAQNGAPYFVTIEPFADGGKTYYTSLANVKTALGVTAVETKNASQDTAIAKAQSTADSKVSKAGDTMTGNLVLPAFKLSKNIYPATSDGKTPAVDSSANVYDKVLHHHGDLDWRNEAIGKQTLVSQEALAYWNGRFGSGASNLQYFKGGEIAAKTEIPRPLWLADSVILTDAGVDATYTINKTNIAPLVATGYTIMASDKIMFQTDKALYLGVVTAVNETTVSAKPKFDAGSYERLEGVINNTIILANTGDGGFAAGLEARTKFGPDLTGGGAIGYQATTTGNGGSIGWRSYSSMGGGVGAAARAIDGGAVGYYAGAGAGFSGGAYAKVKNTKGSSGDLADASGYIDAIQLGKGTNEKEKSLQIYDDNIYDANTHTLTVTSIKSDTTDTIASLIAQNTAELLNKVSKSGDTMTGALKATKLTSNNELIAGSDVGDAFYFRVEPSGNVGLELGRRDGTKGMTYIDMVANGSTADFDCRITGGTLMQIDAPEGLTVNGNKVATTPRGDVSSYSSEWQHYVEIGDYLLCYGCKKTGTVNFPRQFSQIPYAYGCGINRAKSTADGRNYCSSVSATAMYIEVGTEWGYWWALGQK